MENQQSESSHPRKSITQSIQDLTDAMNRLATEVHELVELQKRSIPYPMVLLMFAIVAAALFGVEKIAGIKTFSQ